LANAIFATRSVLGVLLDALEARGIDADFWQAVRDRQEAALRRTGRQAERDVLRKHCLQWNE
jgi:hypothetical protein